MRKIWYLVFVFVFLVGFISSVSSDSISDLKDSIDDKAQNVNSQIENTKEIVSDKDARNEYLKNEWIKILESRPVFKQIISGYRTISPYSDPMFEFIIGVIPQFSLLFFLSMIICFVLLKYFFVSSQAFIDVSFFSRQTSVGISLSVFVILMILGVFRTITSFISSKIVEFVNFITSPIMKIVTIVLFFVAFILLTKYDKYIKIFAGKYRIYMNEKKQVGEIKEIKENVENMSSAIDSVSSGFSYSKGMRRGGEKSNRGRFVSKKSTERYARMFGDDAAKERFGG